MHAKFNLKENVQYQLTDKSGKAKSLFQENALCIGLIRRNILNPQWLNKWYAPIVMPFFGNWASLKLVANTITNQGAACVAGLINGDRKSVV